MTTTKTNNPLPDELVSRIFDRLLNIYGNGFLSKFSRVDEHGRDLGILGAKEEWAKQLGGFGDKLGAIAYAIENLPPDFPPNVIQFSELCRTGAKRIEPPVKALSYTPDPEKQRAFAAKLHEIVSGGNHGANPVFWATHPKGHLAFEYIRGAAKNNPTVFQPCIDHLIAEGKVSEDGQHLLQKYVRTEYGPAWVAA